LSMGTRLLDLEKMSDGFYTSTYVCEGKGTHWRYFGSKKKLELELRYEFRGYIH